MIQMPKEYAEQKRHIIELFNSVQGEGITAGTPTVFVRLSGCNLRCMFDNSICDTAYSSFRPEKGKYSYKDVGEIIEKNPTTTYFSISGGEPFLNPIVMNDLIAIAHEYGKFVVVETNGTKDVDEDILSQIDLINISPKLSSSNPNQEKIDKLGLEWTQRMKNHNNERQNIDAICKMIHHCCSFQLKYVVGREEDFKEIEDHIRQLMEYDIKTTNRKNQPVIIDDKEMWYDIMLIRPRNIVLMPAGSTNEELNQNRKMVAEYCAKKGYMYSDRLQIVIWETERNR